MLDEDLKQKQNIILVSVPKCNSFSVKAIWVEQLPY